METTDKRQEHHLTLMSWLVFSCGTGVLLQWCQVAANSGMRGHSHNGNVMWLATMHGLAVDCTAPSVKSLCAHFTIVRRKHDKKGNQITSHTTRLAGSLRSYVFNSCNIRDVSSKNCAVCLVRLLWNTPWAHKNFPLVFWAYQRFDCTPVFHIPIITYAPEKQELPRDAQENEALRIEIMRRVTCDTQNCNTLKKKLRHLIETD